MNILAMIQEEPVTVDALHKTAAWFFWAGGTAISTAMGIAALLGLFVLTMAMAPGLTTRCSTALRERGFLSFFAGTGIAGAHVLLLAIGTKAPPLAILAIASGSVFTLVGLTATAEDLGRRIAWACGRESSRVHNVVTGWLAFSAAACVPIVGWFIVLPFGAFSGIGASVVGLLSRGTPTAVSRMPVDMEIR
jgi:hypothetical protein